MEFKKWLEGHRELASAYKQTLGGVPQHPEHHPEGDVLAHVRLVRKAIPRAIQELNQLKSQPPFSDILSDIDFNLSPQEFQLVSLAAWLHDIGKATATTTTVDPKTQKTKISSIAHETPKFYVPPLKQLKQHAPEEMVQLYMANAKLLNFLVMRHMDFIEKTGFPSNVVRNYFKNGKVINTPEMKLLLVLMWSDKLGRGKPEDALLASIRGNADRLAVSSQRSAKRDQNIANTSKPYQGTPEEMDAMLQKRGVDPEARRRAIQNKFPNV